MVFAFDCAVPFSPRGQQAKTLKNFVTDLLNMRRLRAGSGPARGALWNHIQRPVALEFLTLKELNLLAISGWIDIGAIVNFRRPVKRFKNGTGERGVNHLGQVCADQVINPSQRQQGFNVIVIDKIRFEGTRRAAMRPIHRLASVRGHFKFIAHQASGLLRRNAH